MTVFGDYAHYYQMLYRDKDYAREAVFVKRLLQQHARHSTSILELGCGSGNHAAAFLDLGFSVCGVDRSPEMLEHANRKLTTIRERGQQEAEFVEADIRDVRIGKTFDAVLSLFHVISYLQSDQDLSRAFDSAAVHLSAGGLFVFDCWYGPTVLSVPPEVRVKKVEDSRLRITRICEPELLPNENLVLCRYTVFVEEKASGKTTRLEETHRMRYLFRPEVESLLAAAGLEIVTWGEWLTDKRPGTDTFGVYFAARKI